MNPKFHLSLDVADLEASIRFYSTLLNSAPSKLKPGYAKFDLESPAINLTMQEKSHCCLQGISHVGLRVNTAEEIQTIKQRRRLYHGRRNQHRLLLRPAGQVLGQ